MPSFRVTYHTTGGPFSRVVEAKSAEAAEKSAIAGLEAAFKAGSMLTFTENEIRFSIITKQVAAISVEDEKAPTPGGERRSLGFLGR